jgi:glycosyltransferase involved in cell wall biosynthesis
MQRMSERGHPVAVELSSPTSRRLRVGFVLSTEVGLKTFYLNWRDCLPAEAEVDPTWIVIDWWQEGGSIERLPLLPTGVKSRLRAYQQLYAGLGGHRFDVLYVSPSALFYGNERRLMRQPYVLTLDSTPEQQLRFGGLYGQPSRIPGVEAGKRRLRERAYRGAAAIFPWSRWAAGALVDEYGLDPSRVHVVPPGIDLATWTVPPRRDDGDGDVQVLFVGGDFYRKGGDLLTAWADTTRLTGWQLHLVTRDRVTTSNPRVHVCNGLTSNDPQLRKLYEQAHVFALPTRADCYSLASMEAMAAGLPVIVSEVGGTGDIIRDGETGFLIPPGDGSRLAASLDALVADRSARQRMGLAARRDAEERYDARKNNLRAVEIMRAAVGLQPAAR